MINNKNESLKNSIEEFCSVCGYEKTSRHYGVITCSSCKIFFRRNADLNFNLKQCRYQQECQININNRTICRVCRLKKCFSVGMNKNLFRSSDSLYSSTKFKNEKKKDNKCEDKHLKLTFNQQIEFNNLINNYDLCSPILDITQIINNTLNNPLKIRLKMLKNNFILIEEKFYSSIILFIKLNNKFNCLSNNDRYQLIKRNIQNLFQLNQLFIFNQINYLNDPIKINSILDQYGSLYTHYLLKTIQKIPLDTKIIKLFFIILTFSTCSDKINFQQHRFDEKQNCLSNSLNLLNIQNIYLEIFFKYLIKNSNYEQSTKQFTNLIQIVLTQNYILEFILNNQKHYQIIQNILNKIKQDYQQIIDSSN